MGAADFENLLKASMGLNVASIGASAIERAVHERVAACSLDDPRAYWDHVRGSDVELQELIEAVVVPETWFFRDREAFVALARFAREELERKADGVLSLLSLPCSTGEEPYSMAMALVDASIPADRFHIDAVDISTRALKLAERAVYTKNSFRGGDLTFRDRHFEATTKGYCLSDTVRRQVRFQQGNLLGAEFLPGSGRYDVIFCRNVLIYFDRATQDRVIVVLERLLKAKGVLFVAPAETSLPTSHGFVATNMPLAFAFRRRDDVPAQPRKVRAAAPRPAQYPTPRAFTAAVVESPAALVPEPSADIGDAMRLADQGHFVEAAMGCAAHLRQQGPSAAAFYLMGLVRDATGNQLEAVGHYRKALYLEPNHYEAQIHLALLMEKQGDAAGALVLRNRAQRVRATAQDLA